ncbi:MAG TPA: MG2 domain-containing protein, partial [Desulfobacterales bacterium]|nr:MG2 domain-containing protein [Desulfobacterales bacterium]
MRRKLLFLVLSLLFLCSSVLAQEAPKVSGFTPQGTVKKVRQVRASFSEPMVAFGDPRAAAPFAVQCSEEGRGRWADPGNWVYDFERDLPGGIRCSFKLAPGLRTLSGKTLAGKRDFSFSTGGPAIRNSLPYGGNRGIGEDQVFILILDSAPDEASILSRAGFSIAGIQQRVGAQIITGAEREAILSANRWLFNSEPDRGKYVLLQCRQRLPQKAKVSLVWGKGISSASGVATEQDQVLTFETREAFLAEFHCERENPRSGCIPVLPMSLRFNAALDPGQTGAAVLKGSDGKTWSAPLGKDGSRVTFEGPLPANADFLLELPAGIKDDAGRALTNANRFPLKVRTAGYPPLAKFAARFGIVERNADPALPVTIRNIEPQPKARMLKVEADTTGQVTGKIVNVPPGRAADVQPWLRRVAAAKRDASLFTSGQAAEEFKIPKTLGTGALEVVGIPLKKPGLYIVEIESAILGQALLDAPKPMYVPAAVLVTNLSVHFKQGRESSLVWVTTLDQAEPMAGADVAVMDCAGKVLWRGRTDADGIARIDAELAAATDNPACAFELPDHDTSQLGALRRLGEGLFITAETSDDMSFVHSSWDEGIEAWRFKLPAEYGAGPVIAHTIFDRSLLRAGETVHMKHLIRRHTMDGFAVPQADRLPDTASIRHAGSKQAYEMPLTWDASGVAETDWSIPKEAKLGSYSVTLMRKSSQPGPPAEGEETGEDVGEESNEFAVFRSLTSGRFRVEEFRLPLLKGAIQPPSQPLVNAKEAVLDLSVQYLAGGGAGLLPVKLRADVAAKRLPAFEGFDDFVFGNGPVKEGLVRRGEQDDTGEAGGGPKPKLMTVDLVLDSAGTARTVVPGLPAADAPQEMTAEMEFRDPN